MTSLNFRALSLNASLSKPPNHRVVVFALACAWVDELAPTSPVEESFLLVLHGQPSLVVVEPEEVPWEANEAPHPFGILKPRLEDLSCHLRLFGSSSWLLPLMQVESKSCSSRSP